MRNETPSEQIEQHKLNKEILDEMRVVDAEARAAEREACAQIADELAAQTAHLYGEGDYMDGRCNGARLVAKRIRARANQDQDPKEPSDEAV